jgi:ABC-2 type transport system permease protein
MWRIIKTLLVTQYAYMLEYRAELLLWALSGSLPIILMGVWNQAATNGQFELSAIQFIRYFLAVFIVRQMNVVWVIYEFEKEVIEGRLSARLLQPLDPAWHHLTAHISERLARLPFLVGLITLGLVLYPEAVWIPNVLQILQFSVVVVLAFGLRFLMQYTFALCAFWTERAMAIEQLWFLFYLFLSGMIAPIELFPAPLQAFIQWTPFPYLIYFPAAILVGLPVNINQGFLAIGIWSGIFWVLNRWLWKQGLKQYSGMGA